MVWIIHDRKKFGSLVTEIKDLVDSLQGFTSPSVSVAQQAGMMRQKIVNIHDSEELSQIAEVCSEDHPDIADAASTIADSPSFASTDQQHVAAWTEGLPDTQMQAEDGLLPDLESLTVTELKHQILEMRKEWSRVSGSLDEMRNGRNSPWNELRKRPFETRLGPNTVSEALRGFHKRAYEGPGTAFRIPNRQSLREFVDLLQPPPQPTLDFRAIRTSV